MLKKDKVTQDIMKAVVTEDLVTGDRVKTANFGMNLKTTLAGMQPLLESGILVSRPGLGIFVADGALEEIKGQMVREMGKKEIPRLVGRAKIIGLTSKDVAEMVKKEFNK